MNSSRSDTTPTIPTSSSRRIPKPIGTGLLVRLKPGHEWNWKDDTTVGGRVWKVLGHQALLTSGHNNAPWINPDTKTQGWTTIAKNPHVKLVDFWSPHDEMRAGFPKVAHTIKTHRRNNKRSLETYDKAAHLLSEISHQAERWIKKWLWTYIEIGETCFSVMNCARWETRPGLCLEEDGTFLRIVPSQPYKNQHGYQWSIYIDTVGRKNDDLSRAHNYKLIPQKDNPRLFEAKICDLRKEPDYQPIPQDQLDILEKISDMLLSEKVQEKLTFPD